MNELIVGRWFISIPVIRYQRILYQGWWIAKMADSIIFIGEKFNEWQRK